MDFFILILWCFKVFPTGYEWHCSGRRINCMGSGKNICIYIIQITYPKYICIYIIQIRYPSEHFQQRKWNYFFLLVHEHWWILCGYVVFSLKKRLWCIRFQKQIVETVGHCICKNYNYKGGWWQRNERSYWSARQHLVGSWFSMLYWETKAWSSH